MSQNTSFSVAKQKAQASWRDADYATFATCLEYGLTDFLARLSIEAGDQVLDVACGSGNVSVPIAQRGAVVTGIDFNPDALEAARSRADEAKLAVQFDEGDIEQMPYAEHTFDWGISVFGIMFALNAEAAAQELTRVCKPTANIAIASWTAESLVGQLAKTLARYRPAAPGTARTSNWGDEQQVAQYLGGQTSQLKMTRRPWRFMFPYGPDGVVNFFRQYSGSHTQTFALLSDTDAAKLQQELEAVWVDFNIASDGTTIADAEYLDVQGVVGT